jgi:outer membrane biosynthesis protein TonB
MNVNVEELDRQLAGLTGRFADLGAKLSEAARELQDGGAPPTESLVEQLSQLRTQSMELCGDVAAAAQAVGIAVPATVDTVTSLAPLLRAIAAALEARRRHAALEQARRAVIDVLDVVLGVRHLDEAQFTPLVDCQLQARDLHAAVMALNETNLHEAQELTARVRAFSDFLTMLEGADRVDDERFARLEANVSAAFGRPLAVAAARGRLLRPGQTPPPPPAPAPPPVVEAPPAPVPTREVVVAAPAPPIAPPPPVVAPPPPPSPPPAPRAPAAEPRTMKPKPAEPVAPAAASGADASFDETAQWWLAAWARWSGWRGTTFPDAVREELSKYSYLLSVPMQKSHEYEDGLLAYGYSILVDHVEKQNPGCVSNALNRLKSAPGASVGAQIFEYLLTDGRLADTYPDFIKNVLLAALPDAGPWVDARIVHTKDDTRIFRRPTARLGDSDQKPQRLLADKERFAEHKFSFKLPALTTRFVQLSPELKDAHGLETRLSVDGVAAETGWVVTVPQPHRTSAKIEARPFTAEGTAIPGIGRDFVAIWVAVFNPQPRVEAKYDLTLVLRKDTKGMKK